MRMGLLILLVMVAGCSSRSLSNKGGVDIEKLNLNNYVVFDIRLLKDTHGEPDIIDPEGNALIYKNTVLESSSWFGNCRERSTTYYLVLNPMDTDKMYKGAIYYNSASWKSDESSIRTDRYKTASAIASFCRKK